MLPRKNHKMSGNVDTAFEEEVKKIVNFEKYSHGPGVQPEQVQKREKLSERLKRMATGVERMETNIHAAEKLSAKTEVLLPATEGLLEADDYCHTSDITQKTIAKAVDLVTAAKSFDLMLTEFGPYRSKFFRDGRFLLLGGRKGHVSMFDFVTKKLHFEINVMESIHDLTFLHNQQMCAVAQKQWTYLYDHQGTEIHCLKQFFRTVHLEFLPHHFLLVSGGEDRMLQWLDVTLGKEIVATKCINGRVVTMCQNPYNAVICCGHPTGTVSMWTPNSKEAVASVMCHSFPVRAIDFDLAGRYMATCANHWISIWDARNLGTSVASYWVPRMPSGLRFSQRGLLASIVGNTVEVFRNITQQSACEVYMQESFGESVTNIDFCPFDDFLGVGRRSGFTSLIIPGSGEPNIDAYEANPFASKSSRRESEVKALLQKVPASLITLDPKSLIQVDIPTLKEKLEAKQALTQKKLPHVDFTPRYRMKGKSGSAQRFKRKRTFNELAKSDMRKQVNRLREEVGIKEAKSLPSKKMTGGVLDRFL